MARRNREWFTKQLEFESLAALTQSGTQLCSGLQDSDRKGATLVRLILRLSFRSNSSNSDGELAFGIGFMNADAFAAGAFPDPNAADIPENQWLIQEPRLAHLWVTQATFRHMMYDLRAMRKMRTQDDRCVLVLNNLSSTSTLDLHIGVRMLFLRS